MALPSISRRSRRLAIAALLAAPAIPAVAQYPVGAVVQPLGTADDPGQRLAAALRTLSTNSADLGALREAGRSSLLLGDANAAAGFYGRADQINPRDGRVKAGLGAALTQLERPADALPLFAQAAALGVPAGEFASDRGLAYDLAGDTQAAQRDYRAALAANPGDEVVRRRLALSQGIAGDRRGAIETLDPLIRRRDIAAWRAQTFVLAMTGDPQGANAITRVMLPQQQAALQPFLVRLAALTPAQKARAVHFGEMPGAGAAPAPPLPMQTAAASPPPIPARPSDLAPVRAAPAPVQASQAPVPDQAAPRPLPVSTPAAPAAMLPPQALAARAPAATLAPAPGAGASAQSAPAGAPLAALAPDRDRPDLTTAFRDPIGRRRPQGMAVAANTVATPRPSEPQPAPVPPPAPQSAPAVPPAIVTTAVPPGGISPSSTSDAAALPQGSSASIGHYDLPHAVARPPARVALPPRTPAHPVESAPAAPAVHRAPPKPKPAPVDETDAVSATKVARTKSRAHDEAADDTHAVAHGRRTLRTAMADEADAPRGKGRRSGDDVQAAKPSAKHGKAVEATRGDADDDATPAKGKATRGKAGRSKDQEASSRDEAARGKTEDRKAGKDDAKPSKGGKGNASRVYVQVAGGANRDDLGKAWAGVRKQAPDLMKGRSPSTTPLKATNRLLVGPFKNEDEAQTFVNKMAGKGVSGFVFKSTKGQKVDKVDTGG